MILQDSTVNFTIYNSFPFPLSYLKEIDAEVRPDVFLMPSLNFSEMYIFMFMNSAYHIFYKNCKYAILKNCDNIFPPFSPSQGHRYAVSLYCQYAGDHGCLYTCGIVFVSAYAKQLDSLLAQKIKVLTALRGQICMCVCVCVCVCYCFCM